MVLAEVAAVAVMKARVKVTHLSDGPILHQQARGTQSLPGRPTIW